MFSYHGVECGARASRKAQVPFVRASQSLKSLEMNDPC